MIPKVNCFSTKEIQMKKLILIAVMCLFSGFVVADQIVQDKDGKAVLLKDDNTWEFIDTSKEKGKIVFSIAEAKDSFIANRENKDDMDEVKSYSQFFGCEYYFEIENNTSYKVKINNVGVGTTLAIDDIPADKIFFNQL